MAKQYNYLGGAVGFISTGTALPVSYVSQSGSTLLAGVLIAVDSVSVLGMADNVGLDNAGNAINTWVQIAVVSLAGGGKIEVWEARNAAAIASLNITLSASVKAEVMIGEFTGIGNVAFTYTTSNASATSLTLDETATDAGECFIGFFGAPVVWPSVTNIGTLDNNINQSALSLGMGLSLVDNTITKLKTTFNTAGSVLAVAMTFNVGLSFDHIPGFSDMSDATLAAEQLSLGRKVASISENAAFGMVRLECFSGYFKDGDSVPLPKSPIDGYDYQRDELIYIWGIRDTVSQTSGTGWASGKDTIWYLAANVDQATGKVSTSIGYRRSGSHWTPTTSNDGLLYVITVAQRQKNSLIISSQSAAGSNVPGANALNYVETDDTIYVQDRALTEAELVRLNDNSKFAAVKNEVIYMGEFTNGQTVPQPVSPADGRVYDYSECAMMFSWRWTGTATPFSQPPQSVGQQAQMKASINATTGVVSCSVSFVDDGGTLTTRTSYGRIAVFAVCDRTKIFVSGQRLPWVPGLTDSNGTNPTWLWDNNGLPPVSIPCAPGDSITVRRLSGRAAFNHSPSTDANGDTATETAQGPANFPNHYAITSALGAMGLMGSFADDNGVIVSVTGVKQIRELGNGPTTVVAPAGATQLLIGMNDTAFGTGSGLWPEGPNTGGFIISVTFPGPSVPVADDFIEIDTTNFMPGNFLPASTMKQIDHNVKEAHLSTEIFGPLSKANGSTVALPVGADGYAYSRAELAYIWEWADTTNQTGSNLREPAFYGRIDPSTGRVILSTWRLPPGGSYVDDNNTLCRINVLVIAHRQRALVHAIVTDPVVPADAATAVVDNNTGQTVNGV